MTSENRQPIDSIAAPIQKAHEHKSQFHHEIRWRKKGLGFVLEAFDGWNGQWKVVPFIDEN